MLRSTQGLPGLECDRGLAVHAQLAASAGWQVDSNGLVAMLEAGGSCRFVPLQVRDRAREPACQPLERGVGRARIHPSVHQPVSWMVPAVLVDESIEQHGDLGVGGDMAAPASAQIEDRAGNGALTTAVTLSGPAAPTLVSADTLDADANGHIDHVRLTCDQDVL